ncbi:MAG: hypothetical protein LBU14_01460 [Candidatus Peribacteria bacterium]|nr:hypothetical protein [Candidatus Peribacteria bacterium]
MAENKSENWREELKDMMYTKKVFDIIEKYDDYYDWAFEIVNVVIDEEIDKEIDKILNQKKE